MLKFYGGSQIHLFLYFFLHVTLFIKHPLCIHEVKEANSVQAADTPANLENEKQLSFSTFPAGYTQEAWI